MEEIVSMVIAYVFVCGSLFFLPLLHSYRLIKGKFEERFDDPEAYRDLASMIVINMGFVITVFVGVWYWLKSQGPGSFSGVLLFPVLVIYMVGLVRNQLKIFRLPLREADTDE